MKYKLQEIATIVAGGTPSTKNEEYWNGDIAWITPKDLSNFNKRYIARGERNISELGLNKSSAVIIPQNAILFTSRAPIGYIAIAENDICTNQGFKSLICDETKCYYMYMYYWLLYNVERIKEKANGSTFLEISGSTMKNIEIDLPALNIQKKIGKILDEIDKKIELNNQINDNLQELLNTVFTKWFCEYDYPDQNGQPYKTSGGIMVESELGEIPKDCKIGVFQDIIDFSNGYGFKSNDLLDNEEKETYKVFKQGNINLSGGINEEKTKSWFYKEKAKGLEKFILKKGDILMCMTDMKNSTSPLLGHTALMNVDDEYIVNQRVGLIRCKKEITDYPYVYTMSNLEYFLKDIRSRANSGVQVNLSTNGICKTKIVIPRKTVLDKFNNFAKPLYEIMFNNQKENRNLEQLRDTLLPKLMNGEIDLDKIEI